MKKNKKKLKEESLLFKWKVLVHGEKTKNYFYLNALYKGLNQQTNEHGVKRTKYNMDNPKLCPWLSLAPNAAKAAKVPKIFTAKQQEYTIHIIYPILTIFWNSIGISTDIS